MCWMCGSGEREEKEIEDTRLLILHGMDSKLYNVQQARKEKRNPKMRKFLRFLLAIAIERNNSKNPPHPKEMRGKAKKKFQRKNRQYPSIHPSIQLKYEVLMRNVFHPFGATSVSDSERFFCLLTIVVVSKYFIKLLISFLSSCVKLKFEKKIKKIERKKIK